MSYLEGKYGDSGDEAIRLLGDMIDPEFFSPDDDVDATPDPVESGVWLVFDHTTQMAFIVYTRDGDAEDVQYDEAVKKYGRRRVGEVVLRRAIKEEIACVVKEWHKKYAGVQSYDRGEYEAQSGRDYTDCDACDGDGRIIKNSTTGDVEYYSCNKCKGSGREYLGAYGSDKEYD
jgi:hypothetical protein